MKESPATTYQVRIYDRDLLTWQRAQEKAKSRGVEMRFVILALLEQWTLKKDRNGTV